MARKVAYVKISNLDRPMLVVTAYNPLNAGKKRASELSDLADVRAAALTVMEAVGMPRIRRKRTFIARKSGEA